MSHVFRNNEKFPLSTPHKDTNGNVIVTIGCESITIPPGALADLNAAIPTPPPARTGFWRINSDQAKSFDPHPRKFLGTTLHSGNGSDCFFKNANGCDQMATGSGGWCIIHTTLTKE